MNPTDIHYYIADWALAGNRLNEIGECLWYLNPFKPNCSSVFSSSERAIYYFVLLKMIVWFIVIFIQLNLLQYQQLEFMEEIIIDIIITNIIVAKIKRKLYDNEYID